MVDDGTSDECTVAPNLSISKNNVQCIGDVPVPNITVVTDEADNCTAAPVVAWVSDVSNGLSCPETITRTYSVTDDCSNTINVTQLIVVNDNINPTASNPAQINVQCIGDVPVPNITVVTDEADNCTAAPVVAWVSDVSNGLSCPETITRTYSVTDDCSNTINVTQLIVVNDNINPTASNPAQINVQCIGDVPVPNITVVTDEADNCTAAPVVAWVSDVSNGLSCPETITRTYSVTDDCSNTINVTQLIVVNDNINPTASNPAQINVQCIGDVPVPNITVVTDEADNCTAAPVVAWVSDVSNGLSCPETITRTYSVTDDCSNTINVTQLIVVNDNINPTASNPAQINVQCIGDVPVPNITVVTDEADNCTAAPVVAWVSDVSNGLSCPETITRTYSVTDDCSNTINVTQLIVVNDNINPTASNPAQINVQCIGDVPVPNITVVTDEADNCTAAPVVAWVSDVSNGLSCPETITRTYSVTDDCSNTINVTQLIVVNDNINPTASNPAQINVQCIGDVPVPNITVVTDEADNCTAAPVVAWVSDVSNGLSCPETITRTYSVTDDCSNTINVTQLIVVNDNINPTASNPAQINVQCIGDVPVPNITVVTDEADNCTAAPVVAWVSDVSNGLSCPETITRTYSVTDDCSNTINVTQLIVVNDNINPTASNPAQINVQCIGDVPVPNITVVTDEADNCTAAPVVAWVSDVSNGLSCPETITRTYSVTDDCSNTINVTQLIVVNDNINPTASNPAQINVQCIGDVPVPNITVVTDEADNCTAAPVVAWVSDVSNGLSCPETITRTYSVTDDCSNTINVTQLIVVNDNINPTASNPAQINVQCIGDVPVPNITVVTDEADNCTAAPVVAWVSDVSNGLSCPETITRTYSVTDDCSNTINVTQLIVVNDNINPTASNPAQINVQCIGDVPVPNITVVTDEADNCTAAPVVAWVSDVSNGLSCPETITRTYSVTDDCSNTINVTQLIVVSKSIFDCSNIGDNTVYLIAVDDCGNKDSAQANVEVRYLNPPAPSIVATDTILCDSTATEIILNNSFQLMKFRWEVTGSAQISGYSSPDSIYGMGALPHTISDFLTNSGTSVQSITYTITPIVFGTCTMPATDITIYVHPTPKLSVSVPEEIYCDSSTVNITVNDGTLDVMGTKVYQLTTTYNAGAVEGVQPDGEYPADLDISDDLVNLTREVQQVDYLFKARIRDDRPGHEGLFCDQGGDTIITIYLNPTPVLSVSVADTVWCDSTTVDITVDDDLLGVLGAKVYQLTTTYNPLGVSGVQATGEYPAGTDISDDLVNLSEEVQPVTYHFKSRIKDPRGTNPSYYCDGGNDTSITIYLNPTPKLSVSVPEEIYCDSSTVNITVNDGTLDVMGTKVYQLTTTYNAGAVEGVQPDGEYPADLDISDDLVNLTREVQQVDYLFKARIRDDRPGHEGLFCDQGGDTIITIYLNPTPVLSVSVADTVWCDSTTVDITVDDDLLGVLGAKVYQLTTTYNPLGVSGVQATGEYPAGTDISDDLVNLSEEVQSITYHFKSRIKDPRGTNPSYYCDGGNDTSITIYLNPTPKLSVSVPEEIYCDSSTVNITVNDGTQDVMGTKVYQLTTTYNAGAVEGVQPNGEYPADLDISDDLVNLTQEVQQIDYLFKARIRDDRPGHEGLFCDQGGDTIITIYLNPTPVLSVSVADTVWCDSTTVDITVDDDLLGVLGAKVYQLTTTYNPLGVSGVQATGEYPAGTDISDDLVNLSEEVQSITYHFKSRIKDPRGTNPSYYCDGGNDTSITIYLNPTPKLSVSVPEEIYCDSSTVNITVNDGTQDVIGTKVYQLTTTYNAGAVEGVQPNGEYPADLDISDDLVNLTQEVQQIDYLFKARIRDDRPGHEGLFCDQGGDTIITIYLNPTPVLSVSVADTVWCDSTTVDITVDDDLLGVLGAKVYQLTTTYNPLGVSGVQATGEYPAGTDISDDLVNLSEEVQSITYHFKSRIKDPRGTNPSYYCDGGNDTSITIYLNPTPKLSVSVPEEIYCDSSTVNITVNDGTQDVIGTKVYQLTTTYNAGAVEGVQPDGEYPADLDISDDLVNLTREVQQIDYLFKARIRDDRPGHEGLFCDQGGDTIITIWLNPTPDIIVEVGNDTICNEDFISINVTNPNSTIGNWRYRLDVDYGDSIVGTLPELPLYMDFGEAMNQISDTLVNIGLRYGTVKYTFTPYIESTWGGDSCMNWRDTTITIWVNPTPAIRVVAEDTVICNGETTNIRIHNPNEFVFGEWVYDLYVTPDDPLISGYMENDTALTATNIPQTLFNDDTIVHKVEYRFVPRKTIEDNLICSQVQDTTIVIWVNPTPEIRVTVPDLEICSGDTVELMVRNPNVSVRGRWIFDLYKEKTEDGLLLGIDEVPEVFDGDTTYRYILTNIGTEAHQVTFTFVPRIDPDDGGDSCPGIEQSRTITIYPTPRILPTIPDTLICDNQWAIITVQNPNIWLYNGEWRYNLDVEDPSGFIIGESNSQTIIPGNPPSVPPVEDQLDNEDNGVHEVIYRFIPFIIPGDGGLTCYGVGDTITVWVNPTPSIDATVPDYVFCNYTSANFNIIDNLDSVMGYKIYSTTVTFSEGSMDVFDLSTGLSRVSGDSVLKSVTNWISDSLVNNNRAFQNVFYQFEPAIYDSRPGKEWELLCSVSEPDTTIRIYVNPTPIINIDLEDPILCDGALTQFTVTNDRIVKEPETSLVYYLDVDYNAGPVFPGGITAPGDRPPSDNIQDLLINNSDTVQVLRYSFTARIRDNRPGHEGDDCLYNGTNDTIPIRLNPKPRLSLDFADGQDTLCFGEGFEISTDPEVTATHPLVYNLSVINYDGVTNVSGPGTNIDAGDNLIQGDIQNDSLNVGIVQYEILPIISSEGCEGDPWTKEITLNPNPVMDATRSDWAVCFKEGFELPMNTRVGTTTGQMQYQLRTGNFEPTNIVGPVPAPNINVFGTIQLLPQPLENIGDSIEDITYFFTPVIFDARTDLGAGAHCFGRPLDSIVVEVAPELKENVLREAVWGGWQIPCDYLSSLPIHSNISGGYYRDDYTIVWDTTSTGGTYELLNQGDSVQVGLGVGDYWFHVEDVIGCRDTSGIIEVRAPDRLEPSSYTIEEAKCASTYIPGSIEVIIRGGTKGIADEYTYEWWFEGYQPSDSMTVNGPSGTYGLVVRDSNLCRFDTTYFIGTVDPILVQTTPSDYYGYEVRCNGFSDGEIQIQVNEGFEPYDVMLYEYLGNRLSDYLAASPVETLVSVPSGSQRTFSGLPANNYVVFARDQEGCYNVEPWRFIDTIAEPDPILVWKDNPRYSDTVDISCYGENDGEIHLAVTGGRTHIYSNLFAWTGPPDASLVQNDSIQRDLKPGLYGVMVTDIAGCEGDASFYLIEPSQITMQLQTPSLI